MSHNEHEAYQEGLAAGHASQWGKTTRNPYDVNETAENDQAHAWDRGYFDSIRTVAP